MRIARGDGSAGWTLTKETRHMALIDIQQAKVDRIIALGYKKPSFGNELVMSQTG